MPNIKQGNVVISDRGPMSTFVYQIISAGLTFDELYGITKIANKSVWPDLFILFDMDYEVAKERMDGRELDYFDSKGKDFYDQLSQLYRLTAHHLIEDFGFDVRIINARNSLDYVVNEVQRIIEGKLKI
jgi:dTMP kinase